MLYRITHIASLFLLTFISTKADNLEEVASWRLLTFAPPPGFPGAAPDGGPVYAPRATFTNIQATKDKLFLAIPRFQRGHPITLGWVPRPTQGYQLPLDTPINAFPDWEWHRAAAGGAASAATNCSALVNVLHFRLDQCGRLWAVDSGIVDSSSTFSRACPPKLLTFDTTTGEVLHRFEFGPDVLSAGSLLGNLALDSRSPPGSSCSDPDDLFVYVVDTAAAGLVVYDMRRREAWRHSSPQMYPEPDWGFFTIAGESFTLMDAILGISVSNPFLQPIYGTNRYNIERTLYFQAFSSNRIYSVPTSAVRAKPRDNEILPIKTVFRKSSQSSPLIVDPSDDSLVFAPVSETAIERFQPHQKTLSLVAYDPDRLQSVSDIHIEPERIWLTSTRSQKFSRGTVNPEEVNLRIMKIETGSQCHRCH